MGTARILRFAPEMGDKSIHDIDYVRGLPLRLAPQNTFNRGVLVERIFHESSSLDPNTGAELFDTPIVRETFSYVRDPNGFALQRTLTIEWYNEDGTFDANSKTRTKVYNLTERIRETDIRRRNIIDHIKTKVLGLLSLVVGMDQQAAVAAGQSLFEVHQTDINAFLEIGKTDSLIAAIASDTQHTWLNTPLGPSVTIRHVVLGDLQ